MLRSNHQINWHQSVSFSFFCLIFFSSFFFFGNTLIHSNSYMQMVLYPHLATAGAVSASVPSKVEREWVAAALILTLFYIFSLFSPLQDHSSQNPCKIRTVPRSRQNNLSHLPKGSSFFFVFRAHLFRPFDFLFFFPLSSRLHIINVTGERS